MINLNAIAQNYMAQELSAIGKKGIFLMFNLEIKISLSFEHNMRILHIFLYILSKG